VRRAGYLLQGADEMLLASTAHRIPAAAAAAVGSTLMEVTSGVTMVLNARGRSNECASANF